MITFPNAKLNLGLRILGKRADGYHLLETLFLPITLTDALEIVPPKEATGDTWRQSGIAIDGTAESNTVIRTVQVMREEATIPSLEIELLKKIPFGAGLGGGSADAAFALKMLNQRFSLGLSEENMAKKMARIGADCSFFIYNKPMLGTGIGEVLTPIEIPLELQKASVVLIKPELSISTKEAYSQITCHPEAEGSLPSLLQKPLEEWQDAFVNDFEAALFHRYPILPQIKESLRKSGAFYAAMTGSGSAVYGLFHTPIALAQLQNLYPHSFVWQGNIA